MKGKGETGSATESRTFKFRGWKTPRVARDRWWAAPVALLVVAAILATSVVLLTGGTRVVREEWSAINLSLGSNPLSQQLNISFARVSYLDQPTQWNTTGFLNASLTPNGAWLDNTSSYGTHYGIAQVNSTSTGTTALASWPLSASLGANVSYAFLDQRVALNGTGTTWQLVLSEAQPTGQVATSGNVTNAAAGSAQNEVWVQAFHSAGNYSFLAYDWEEKPGGFQTVTTYTFPSNVFAPPLQFFEVYVYAQPLQTVVSIVNTTNGAVIGSTPAMHPVLDQNLTKIGYLGDTLTAAASSVDSAMILDSAFFVDHNTYANAPGASTAAIPMVAGSVFDPRRHPLRPGGRDHSLAQPAELPEQLLEPHGVPLRLPERGELLLSGERDELADQLDGDPELDDYGERGRRSPHPRHVPRHSRGPDGCSLLHGVRDDLDSPDDPEPDPLVPDELHLGEHRGPGGRHRDPGHARIEHRRLDPVLDPGREHDPRLPRECHPRVPPVEQPRAGQPDHGSHRRRSRHRRVHGPLHGSGLCGSDQRLRWGLRPGRPPVVCERRGGGIPDRLGSRRRPERSSFPGRPRSLVGPRMASPSSGSVVVSSSVSARRSPAPPPPSRPSSVPRRAP